MAGLALKISTAAAFFPVAVTGRVWAFLTAMLLGSLIKLVGFGFSLFQGFVHFRAWFFIAHG